MQTQRLYWVPDRWEQNPETIAIGYYENRQDTYVVIYNSVRRAIAISPDKIEEVPWDDCDFIDSPASVTPWDIPRFN